MLHTFVTCCYQVVELLQCSKPIKMELNYELNQIDIVSNLRYTFPTLYTRLWKLHTTHSKYSLAQISTGTSLEGIYILHTFLMFGKRLEK